MFCSISPIEKHNDADDSDDGDDAIVDNAADSYAATAVDTKLLQQ